MYKQQRRVYLVLSATLTEGDVFAPRVIECLRAYVEALETGQAGNEVREVMQFGDVSLHVQATIGAIDGES